MQDADMEEAGSSSGHSQTVNGKKRKREVEEVPEQTVPDADVNENEATIRFVVRDLHKLSEAQSSPPCYVHSSPTWRIVVMPRISTTSPQRQTLGFIFQCSGDVGSSLRSCFASAELRLISQLEGVQTIVKRVRGAFSCNRFHGFADFLPWNDVLDPAKGYIKDDTIILEVHMVADIPDSKKPNIYMELRYPGATTYLNSLLHTLYFINQFRKVVYQIPAQSNDGRKSFAWALQPLFYKLQIMDKSLDEQTKTLIERLGLNTTTDYFKRHGVHEFVRTLLDSLERNVKGTSVEGMVSKLFEGKMVSYIKCKNVDYSSTQVVTFYDIQLDVTGKKNLSESFSDYMKAEVLDGDNKYDAGEHGLQDAEKYVRFISLPPVLLIHLVRSQYDPSIDGSLQNNERFEFQNKLNLSPFLQTPEGTPAEYTLHTMLFRSCDNRSDDNRSDDNRSDDNRSDDNRSDDNRRDDNRRDDNRRDDNRSDDNRSDDNRSDANRSDTNRSDANRSDANRSDNNLHYAALINAKSYRNLYDKFYDDAGSRSFVHNYGGRVGEINSSPRKPMCVPNAYMMVYIRDSELDNILREVTEDDIPDELVKRLREQTRLIEREAHRMTVEVLLEESFHGHQGSGLFDPDKVSYRPFRADKSTTLQELMDLFARTFKCPVEQLRLWPLGLRWNRTLRPSPIDVAADLRKSLLDVSKGQDPWKVFLEGVPHDTGLSALPPYETDSHVLLFYRMYDPVEQQIHYCGHQCVHVTSTFQDLIPMLNKRAGFPADTELLLFEEIKPDLVRSIRNLCKPMESVLEDFMDGNIIVFQKKPVENQGRLNAEEAEFPTCQEYFRDLYHRMEVTLCDKMNPDDPGVTVELSMMRSYSHLAAAAARRIHTDPDRLRFFTTSKDNPGNAGSAVESNFKGRLKDLFIFPNPNGLKKIYYQQLTMPVFELESKEELQEELQLLKGKLGTLCEILKCPVCWGIMGKDSVLCFNGHSVCQTCRNRLTDCPSCREKFSNAKKNAIASQVLEVISHRCKNENCPELVKPGEDHEQYCCYRTTTCRYESCSWNGPVNELINHLKSQHSKILFAKKIPATITSSKFDINEPFMHCTMYSIYGHYLWELETNDVNTGLLTYTYIPVLRSNLQSDILVENRYKAREQSFNITRRVTLNENNPERNTLPIATSMLKDFIDKAKSQLVRNVNISIAND